MAFREPRMNTDHKTDLDWLAFCYAAGELDAPQAEQFEARLATDQPAREALARAVELTQTVAAAEVHPHVALAAKPHARWQMRVSWMAIGGLAAALLLAVWSGVVGPSFQNARHSLATHSHQHLAKAWTQTREQMASPSAAEIWSDFDLLPETEQWLADELTADAELDEAPSWMMAAVYARSAESPTTETTERLEN